MSSNHDVAPTSGAGGRGTPRHSREFRAGLSITEEVIGMLSAVQTPTKDRSDPSYLRALVVATH
jgi:hypothetical protein